MEKVDKKNSIGFFTIVLINLALLINIRFITHLSCADNDTIAFTIIIALLFFFPICMVVAELHPIWPEDSGIYTWVSKAFGKRIGFITVFLQWFLILMLSLILFRSAADRIAFSFTRTNKQAISLSSNDYYVVLLIIIFTWVAILINRKGISIIKKLAVVTVLFRVIIPLIVMIVLAILYLSIGYSSNAAPPVTKDFTDITSIRNLFFAFSIFALFIGIDAPANYGKVILKPGRYPRAILVTGVLIFIILFVFIFTTSIILSHKSDYFVFNLHITLSETFPSYNFDFLIRVFDLILAIGTIGCTCIWLMTVSKGFVRVIEDSRLFSIFRKENKNNAPVRFFVLQAVITSFLCLLFTLQPTINLAEVMISQFFLQLYLILYIIIFITSIKLRYIYPDIRRPYKIPFGNAGIWGVAIIGIIGSGIAIFISCYYPLKFTRDGHPVIISIFFSIVLLLVLLMPSLVFIKKLKILVFEKSDHSNNSRSKVALTLIILGISAYFVNYVLNVLIARHINASQYGNLAVFLRTVVIVSLLLLLGTNNSVNKYLPKFFINNDRDNIKKFVHWNWFVIRKTFTIYIFALFILYLIMGILNFLGIKSFFSYPYVFYYLAVAPFASLTVLFSSYILSNKWPMLFFFFRKIAVAFIMLALMGGGVLFYNVRINLYSIGVFIFTSYFLVILLELIFINKIYREHKFQFIVNSMKEIVHGAKDKSKWLSDSFKMIGSQLILNLIWAIDFFILETMHSYDNDVGYYAAILVITNVLLITPSAITTFLIPKITHYVEEKKYKELQVNINLINLLNISILAVLLILLLIFSKFLLLIFGKGYDSAEIPFIILCFTYFLAAVFIPTGKILSFLDTGIQFKINIIELIIVIILGVIFTLMWGLTGIALSVFISISTKSILAYINVKRKLKINPLSLF
ncbi:MAG TPA: amino acid permease [Victivallales bacterium]|nr:amino acid permease [Victivallales bacterium]